MGDAERATDVVPLKVATRVWWRVALQSFGGPAGQISVMHRELIVERRWFGEQRFLHALSYCTLLPGPEAQQLAIYLGWLLNGRLGGVIAGTLFVLPGFVAIMALSILYAGWGDTTLVTALFAGIAPAVLAIVAQAVLRLSGRALRHPVLVCFAVAAFVALSLFGVPFPLVIVTAALLGLAGGRVFPDAFGGAQHGAAHADGLAPLIADDALHAEHPSGWRSVRILVVAVLVWVGPVVAVALVFGRDHLFVDQAQFFGGAALVTFGGAYAVLAYVAQRAVEVYGWLAPGEMVTGLAMAETTPGPLIQVVQFVGFMGAFTGATGMDPWLAGVLAAFLVTWVTFVPCFGFIFLGAPHVEALRRSRRLTSALSGVTAAVVGVIANLAVFFAVHTLFDEVGRRQAGPLRLLVPEPASFVPRAGMVAVLGLVVLVRFRWSVVRTLGLCTAVGAGLYLTFG